MQPRPVELTLSTTSRLPSDRALAFFLALVLFGVYLLSFNGRITSSDGLSMFAVTESFIKRGDFSTDQMWTFFATKSSSAPDAEVYSKYGYGTSLFAAPFYALALFVPFSGLMQVTALSSALAIALTGAFLFLAVRRLGFSRGTAAAAALLFGLATPAWVYAKEFWSEPFATLTLFAAFYFLVCYRAQRRTRDALFAGIWLGLALAVRTTNVLLIPLYAGYAFLLPRQATPRQVSPRAQFGINYKIQWRALAVFLVPVFIFTLSILLYNAIRFQNPLTTGYRADETFSNNILLGAYGLLFSPGKGLFVYAPFLAALPFGVWQFTKRFRPELVFALALFTIYLVLFSSWYYWWGGTNWAARFLVPTLPFLILLCAPLVELVLTSKAPRVSVAALRFVFFVLVALSVVNEIAGVAVNSLTFRLRMLSLSPNPDWDSIFSPVFSPLVGHWQTLKPTNLDIAWVRATPDVTRVDRLAIALILFFIAVCGVLLVRTGSGARAARAGVFASLALGLVVTAVVLARAADDPRLGGSPGYAALLQTLEKTSTPRDILVLNDDAQARYFFNANRAPLKWYGLARDPARWDEPTQQIFAANLKQAPRVWFAYDNAVDAPNPMRVWFENNAQALQRLDFPNDVMLVLYKLK